MTIGSLELALLPRPETYVWCVSYLIYQLRKRTYLAVHNLFRQLNLGSTNSQLKKPIVNFEMPPELAFWSHMIVKIRLMYTLYHKKKNLMKRMSNLL